MESAPSIRPRSGCAKLRRMIHRYHRPYYDQVAVFFWPILFFELWRVDRWTAQTGRQAFVMVDHYGRAWVPFFEGMNQKPCVDSMDTRAYRPCDVDALCPQIFERALAALTSDVSESGFRAAALIGSTRRIFPSWIRAETGIGARPIHLDPG